MKATNSKPTTAADQLPLNACADGVNFAKRYPDIASAWKACERPDWMLWFLRRKKLISKVIAVRIAVACAERVLPLFEKRCPNDPRPRAAVEAAREFLKNPTEENRQKSADAAAAYAADAYAADADAYAADADAAKHKEQKAQARIIRRIVNLKF